MCTQRASLIQISKTAPLLIAIFSLMYNRIKKSKIELSLQTNGIHHMQALPIPTVPLLFGVEQVLERPL